MTRPPNCGTGYCSCIECVMQSEQEPLKYTVNVKCGRCGSAEHYDMTIDTTPPQRKPLPASEIVTMYAECPTSDNDMIEFARAVEAAHNIKENT